MWVFEPSIDPGGYHAVFTVNARDVGVARVLALAQAERAWPDNKGLATGQVVSVVEIAT